MRDLAFSLLAIFCSSGFAYGQQSQSWTFDQLFPPTQQRAMGLHKLTAREKAALRLHASALVAAGMEEGKKVAANPRGIPVAPKSYAGVGGGHWIKENVDRGSFIQLEDRSLWQIDRLDKIDASLWLRTSSITVVETDNGALGFDYLLINTDDGEKVHAKYIGIR